MDTDEVDECIARELAVGYPRVADVIDYALDTAEDELDEADIRARVAAALARRRTEEATWTEPTDHERMLAAFEQLEARGILGWEDCGATLSDARAEVEDALAELPAPVRGAVFFHRQDAENAAWDGFLYLDHLSTSDDDVATEIVEALRAEGLTVEWEGRLDRRILVRVPAWRIRRFTGVVRRSLALGYDRNDE